MIFLNEPFEARPGIILTLDKAALLSNKVDIFTSFCPISYKPSDLYLTRIQPKGGKVEGGLDVYMSHQ